MQQPQPFMPMPILPPGPHWRALRTISLTLKIIAWIILVGGIIFALIAFGTASTMSYYLAAMAGLQVMSGLSLLVGSVVGFVILYGYSELIMLMIMIENNTRISAFK